MELKKCPACTDTCSFSKSDSFLKCYSKKDCETNSECVQLDQCYNKAKTTKKPTTTTGKCPPNENWANCRSACEPNCLDNIKKPKPCPRICKPAGCQCIEGFVRDDFTKKCVKREQCPKTTTPFPTTTRKCKNNEIWNYCGSLCEPKCSDDPKKIKPCPLICQVGGDCVCKKDYVRDEVTGECVKRNKCTRTSTPLLTNTPTCLENEHFTRCGTTCPSTCSNYYKKPQKCTKDCFVGCECDEGFVRNEETNECVTPKKCPRNVTHDCPENEHFDECGTACPITCNNYFDPPKICTKQCIVGCQCDKAFVRNEDTGKCVPGVECPRSTTSNLKPHHVIQKTWFTRIANLLPNQDVEHLQA
uniref:TIL domain-containing protein n=1 Tax=Strongyloides papillosus TaxID=174720 RepID=A0A0N5CAQ9_STREA